MKIMIISDCYLPIPPVLGGAVPSLLYSIIKQNEIEKKFDITIFSVYNERAAEKGLEFQLTKFQYIKHQRLETYIDKTIQKGVETAIPARRGRKINALWKYRIIHRLQSLLACEDFDAVILENQGFLTKVFEKKVLLKKYAGKIYYHLHNEIPDSFTFAIAKQFKFLLISEYLSKRIFEKCGTEIKENIHILKNGIPTENYMQELLPERRIALRHQLGFTETDKIVCFIGRICPEKGILELLQAFEHMSDPDIKLLVVGSTEFGNQATSSFENKIIEMCALLGDRVKSTGYIPHDEVWAYYQLADAAALPSIWEEPAGLTILEAMASRLPVITTNAGGIPEYMPSEYGIMLTRDERLPEHIAEAIQNVFADFELWQTRAEGARKYIADTYSENSYYQRFCELLENQ